MTITTKIELKDYLKLSYQLTFRKGFMKIILLFLFLGILCDIANYFDMLFVGHYQTTYSLIFTAYIAIISLFVYINGKKNFLSNKKIQETVIYEFFDDKMSAKGESFVSEYSMDSSYMIQETDKWFLVYHSKQVANLIPKKDMTEAEIVGLRDIFRNASGVKLKLKP